MATIKCRKKLSVGRVQTPTLGLIVDRDRAIENHVKNKYYETDVEIAVEGVGKLPFRYKPSADILGDEKVLLSDEVPNL